MEYIRLGEKQQEEEHRQSQSVMRFRQTQLINFHSFMEIKHCSFCFAKNKTKSGTRPRLYSSRPIRLQMFCMVAIRYYISFLFSI